LDKEVIRAGVGAVFVGETGVDGAFAFQANGPKTLR